MTIEEFEKTLVGKTLNECENRQGFIVRATIIDGEPQMATLDYRLDRVNVAVDDGIITKVLGRG